jgi:hypothetical protein
MQTKPLAPAKRLLELPPFLSALHANYSATMDVSAVQLHSCLWDLSDPCVTQKRMKPAFALAFARAVTALSNQTQLAFPNALLSWRTCSPVSSSYNKQSRQRTIQNQSVLNAAVKSIRARMVSRGRGVWVNDFWPMAFARYDDLDGFMSDGRHYQKKRSGAPGFLLAFLNVFFHDLREKLTLTAAPLVEPV